MALLVQKMTDTNKFRGRGHCTQPSNVQEDICGEVSFRYFCKQFILVYEHRPSCIPQFNMLCFLHFLMWHYLFEKRSKLIQYNYFTCWFCVFPLPNLSFPISLHKNELWSQSIDPCFKKWCIYTKSVVIKRQNT